MAQRVAKDSMGKMKIPAGMLYGASTQRAVMNFPISGRRFPRAFLQALGQIKLSAAKTNARLKLLTAAEARAIEKAAREVRDGRWDGHFVVDVFQTGSGTSTNMNANEVIAALANRYLKSSSSKPRIHPNDHVNKGQSSNDVIPTAIHVSVLLEIRNQLIPELKKLHIAMEKKEKSFRNILKIGRTHLQDATPIRLGQEFGGYATQIKKAAERLEKCFPGLRELAIGGTAVGTGINTHPRFAAGICRDLNQEFSEKFIEAKDHFEAQSAKDSCVETSGQLRVLAVSLIKIANDIRWLGSGPRGGLGEIKVPPVQPGSSIMPGKVNPVMAEAVIQVCNEVIGSDLVVALSGQSGNFELNVAMPVMAYHLLESIRLLTNVCNVFRLKCIDGIKAERVRCEAMLEKSLMLSTPLVPVIGYDQAAKIAKEAFQTGRTIREIVLKKGILTGKEASRVLDVKKMV